MSSTVSQPNAIPIRLFIHTDDLANAKPICLAAQMNIIRYPSESPNGVSVLPVPVGAV